MLWWRETGRIRKSERTKALLAPALALQLVILIQAPSAQTPPPLKGRRPSAENGQQGQSVDSSSIFPVLPPDVRHANLTIGAGVHRYHSSNPPLLGRKVVFCDDDERFHDEVGLPLVPLGPLLEAGDVLPGPSLPKPVPERRDTSPSSQAGQADLRAADEQVPGGQGLAVVRVAA
ncbi:uncharacterized protein LOC128263908 [Drosophila gunungcola]|uniref:uncharacterized protein LOC128263908 n=1 Tax=Drosophila gunungcola TaxID=103775 RepID=UPI0022E18C34|nr:uncharacterized protein LOC128263908 [Drosophila gunungcola]